MSDFVREALEDKLNAQLCSNIAAVRAEGFEIEGLEVGEEPLRLVLKRRAALPALPGPGAGSSDDPPEAETPARKPAKRKAKNSGRSCRFCRRQLRGDNATGVCSSYGCRKELEKEQVKSDAGSDDDAGK